MKRKQILWNEQGATAIEFAMTAPLFLMFIFAIIEGGLVLWTQLGLQHGTELAARCAAVNKIDCGDSASIQSFAAKQAYGLDPSPSTFTVVTDSCGKKVSATYTYSFFTRFWGMPSFAVNAEACFPLNS